MSRPRCTNCGAELAAADPGELLACGHCGAALYLELHGASLHYLITPAISIEEAQPRLRHALDARQAQGSVELESCRMVFAPYFCAGDVRRGTLCSGLALPGDLPREVLTARGELSFFDESLPRDAEVLLPELEARDVSSDAPQGEAVHLVHVPFFRVRYRCQGQSFIAAVDATDGQVHAEEWPASPERQRNRELWFMALSWAAAFALAMTLSPSWPWTLLGLTLVGVGGQRLALWHLRRLGL